MYVLLSSVFSNCCRGLYSTFELSCLGWKRFVVVNYFFRPVPLELVVSVIVEDFFKPVGVLSLNPWDLTSSPFLISYEKISDHSALKDGFLVTILLISLTTSRDTLGSLGIRRSVSSIIMINFPMFLLSKGQYPNSILNKTTPRDQISVLIEYSSPLRTSGAM